MASVAALLEQLLRVHAAGELDEGQNHLGALNVDSIEILALYVSRLPWVSHYEHGHQGSCHAGQWRCSGVCKNQVADLIRPLTPTYLVLYKYSTTRVTRLFTRIEPRKVTLYLVSIFLYISASC